jgi:hypothetical protein
VAPNIEYHFRPQFGTQGKGQRDPVSPIGTPPLTSDLEAIAFVCLGWVAWCDIAFNLHERGHNIYGACGMYPNGTAPFGSS